MSNSSPVGMWRDGRLIQPEPVDPGLLMGLGVFETLLVESGRVFCVDKHVERLRNGAMRLGLPQPERQEIVTAIQALLGISPVLPLARLRLTWTPGGIGQGELLATVAPYSRPRGSKVVLSRYVRNERSILTGIKATAYAENLLALKEAQAVGAQEAIFANTVGFLAEGATSNVFVEKGGRIITPPLTSGCLPGITRALCLEWGREAGLDIAVEPLPFSVMNTTQHVALTSALKGVFIVDWVGERRLESGPLLKELSKIYTRKRQGFLTTSPSL